MDTHSTEKEDEQNMKMNAMDWIAFVLVIIGGLNWGLVRFFDFNLVAAIFGDMTTVGELYARLLASQAFIYSLLCQ